MSEEIAAPAAAVFDLVHDYDRRLDWDTLLSAAYIDDGSPRADKGVVTVCVGRRSLGKVALRTVYVSFQRPKVAAVALVDASAVFATWAASIRHHDLGPNRSRITYTFSLTTRPRLIEPIVMRVFAWETRKRLAALRRYFASHPASA